MIFGHVPSLQVTLCLPIEKNIIENEPSIQRIRSPELSKILKYGWHHVNLYKDRSESLNHAFYIGKFIITKNDFCGKKIDKEKDFG